MKKEEYTVIQLSEKFCGEVEEFLRERPEFGNNVEEFVTGAGELRVKELSPRTQVTQPARAQAKEDYSEPAVEAADHALNRTSPPTSVEEKTQVFKGIAACYRNLKKAARESASDQANRGDIR